MLKFKDLKYVNGFQSLNGEQEYILMFYSYALDNYFLKLKKLDEKRYYKLKSLFAKDIHIDFDSRMIEYHYKDIENDIILTSEDVIENSEKFEKIKSLCIANISKIIVETIKK